MRDFLTFRRMLTPVLLIVLFWVVAVFCVVAGIYDMFTKDDFIRSLEVVILGPIAARIVCEWMILAFRINETLTDIREGLQSKSN